MNSEVKRRCAVLGHPIEHSLSPVLHRAAYRELGLDWEYSAIDTTEQQLPDVVEGLDASWAGLSLTMPLKVAAVPLVDFMEPMAKFLSIINTVIVQHSGQQRTLVGANTDVHGIVAALKEAGVTDAGESVILGGGATATSAMAALGQMGSFACIVAVRDRARAAGMMRAATKMGVSPRFVSFDQAHRYLDRASTVVSTVPVSASDELAAALTTVRPGAAVLDVNYAPPEGAFAREWRRLGGVHVPGHRMLLHQATEQVRLITGQDAPIEAMDAALTEALAPQ